jgi:hypothetical protein
MMKTMARQRAPDYSQHAMPPLCRLIAIDIRDFCCNCESTNCLRVFE